MADAAHPIDDLPGRLLADVVTLAEEEQTAALRVVCERHPELADDLRARHALFLRLRGAHHGGPSGVPQRFAEYELVRELGRGGMGVVYLARQRRGDQERFVALKLVRDRLWLAPQARERLRREGAAAFRLEHPGICQAYDVGEVEGTPFVAMRYVPGVTLAAIIADAHTRGGLPTLTSETSAPGNDATTDASSPLGNERIRALLALIEQVARALHVAHEAGFVHRDVKPGNIMVTPDGAPVLLDFGLVHDESSTHGLTITGQPLGTPTYMAPEQIDPRGRGVGRTADVYALGVTLYEALAGEPPFAGHNREELFRQILDREPRALRRRIPGVSRDLAVVVETATAKDPARRYATALAMAEDLRRVRSAQPILARPPGPVRRLHLWTRRNRLAAAVLLLLIASQALVVVLAVRAERRTDEALTAKQAAIDAQDIAERNFADASEAMYELTEVARQHLADVPWMEAKRKELFERVLAFHERVRSRRAVTPAERLQAATAKIQSARLLIDLGDSDRVREVFDGALADFDALPREDVEVQRWLARLHLMRAKFFEERDYTHQIEAEYQAAIALFGALQARGTATQADLEALSQALRRYANFAETIGGRVEDAERALVRAEAAASSATTAPGRMELAAVLRQRGRMLRNSGDTAGAALSLQRSCALLREILVENPHEPTARMLLASALISLGVQQKDVGQHEAALDSYRESAQISEQLSIAFPYVPQHRGNLANALSNTAVQLRRLGRDGEARPLLERALPLIETVAAEEPDNLECQGILGRIAANLANQVRREDPARALDLWRRAMLALDRQLERTPSDFDALDNAGRAATSLGATLAAMGREDEAQAAWAAARRHDLAMLRHHGDHPRLRQNLAQLEFNEGTLLSTRGDLATACEHLATAVANCEALVALRPADPRAWSLLSSHRLRRAVLEDLRDPARSTAFWERAAATEQEAPAAVRERLSVDGSARFDLGTSLRGLATSRLRENKLDEAASLLGRVAALIGTAPLLPVQVERLLLARDRLDVAQRNDDQAAIAEASAELVAAAEAIVPLLAGERFQSMRLAQALPAIEALLVAVRRQDALDAVRALAVSVAR